MLKEKVAVVTGGAAGIGKAIGEALAAEGADVAILDCCPEEVGQQAAADLSRFGGQVKFFPCNVADFTAVKDTVAAVSAAFGHIDILVNNAGIARDGLVATMTEANYDMVLNVDLKGAFNMIRHIAPLFIRQRHGKIVNIASVAGILGNAGQANYSAAKAGLIGLTKAVARELAPRGVNCNAVAPGFVSTHMTENIDPDSPLMKSVPLGRVGEPTEIAQAVAFLVSDRASYITGEVLRVDGGIGM